MKIDRIAGILLILQAVLGVLPFTARAQNAKKDLDQINIAFQKNKSFSMELTYNLYSNFSTAKIFSTKKAEVQKDGVNQYFKLSTIETLVNDQYALAVDNDARTIILNRSSTMQNKDFMPISLDTLIKRCNSVEYLKGDGDIVGYAFKMSFSDYQQVDIMFNSKTYQLKSIVLYSRVAQKLDDNDSKLKKEKPRLEILISKLNTHPQFDESTFSQKRFVTIKGKTVSGTGKYSNYKVYNAIKNN